MAIIERNKEDATYNLKIKQMRSNCPFFLDKAKTLIVAKIPKKGRNILRFYEATSDIDIDPDAVEIDIKKEGVKSRH